MPDTGYSRSPRLNKGAFVTLTDTLGLPVPLIIPFQYNPATISRTLTPYKAPDVDQAGGVSGASAQPTDPDESISIQELHLDASDQLEDGEAVAKLVGVGERIAAIESMLYPAGNPFSQLLEKAASLFGAPIAANSTVPITLLVMGEGRILPVRVSEYSIEEQQFLPNLRPMRATISIGLQVQRPDTFQGCKDTASVKIAKAAYTAHRAQQSILAAANSVSNADELLAILPF